jgi:hypothetical protein
MRKPVPGSALTTTISCSLLFTLATLGMISGLRYGNLDALSPHEKAVRIIEFHGEDCEVVSAGIPDEGLLAAECSNGDTLLFDIPLPCAGEDPMCDFLGIDAACWEVIPMGPKTPR